MIIQNKKNGKNHEVSAADYQFLKDKHLHLLYRVIDKSNTLPSNATINIPKEIKEFQVSRPERIIIEKPIEQPVKKPIKK